MAMNEKKTWILSVIQVSLYSYSFHYAASSIRFSAHHDYFDYCITSKHGSRGLSEYRIVLKLSGFRFSGLSFLPSRLYHNKPASAAPGALKPDHAYAILRSKTEQLKFNAVINSKFIALSQVLINNFQ